ncbi:MAG TPA: hypothetical protein GXX70_04065 [Tepidimicrobium sp.]|nr:hypothetical protein [Tepidimicrobium sp.]
MIGILLNIIGITIVVLSLFFISRTLQHERELYEEIKLLYADIKDYSSSMENTLNDFYELVEVNLDRIESLNKDNNTVNAFGKTADAKKESIDNIFVEGDEESLDSREELNRNIMRLKEVGLSNEEIAKKVNKGIREVEIIIKMWGHKAIK